MVSVDLAALAPGVTVIGENEQVRVFGRPAQESATGLLNAPDRGVVMTVKAPDAPEGIVKDEGVALNEKVGGCPPVQVGV
jgi:hypothetical protein